MVAHAVKEAVIIVVVAAGLALAVYAARPDKIGLSPPAGGSRADAPVAGEGILEITLADAWRHYEAQNAIFADARHATDYAAGHIRGAISMNPADPQAWLGDVLASTDAPTLIITYCDGESCHLATELAEILSLNGFENVRYLKNGWTRWRDSGHPVE